MKLTIKQLKKLIKEEFYHSKPREEIIDIIMNADRDEIASKDYVDDETGEVMWEKGEAAGETSGLSLRRDDSEEREEQDRLDAEEEARWEAEENAEDPYDSAFNAYNAAIAEFVNDFGEDTRDYLDDIQVSVADAVGDLADQFFYQGYPWKEWATALGLSKQNIKERLADEIYNKLS